MPREFYGATVDAQRVINERLSLPASGREQDWEIELANPDRVEEMLELASDRSLDFDQRCALALLTIASIDEAMDDGQDDNWDHVEEARSVLARDNDVRAAMIFFWIDQKRASNPRVVEEILIG